MTTKESAQQIVKLANDLKKENKDLVKRIEGLEERIGKMPQSLANSMEFVLRASSLGENRHEAYAECEELGTWDTTGTHKRR
ncbi:MAG: hypothetical protein EOS51_24305 [Mesorhizobium sp.]|uniref:hypothetical protein n=1 Tax=unclassified Mesorhizobium TaxID=325217 RepID=UPI000FE53B83|nr:MULTISPECIES: hypothetical protein [unclassified Mesorhizobium]RWC09529.1 MAG: hypothetical protein EOS51_24305 [Mesorhizobium sp.]TGT93877.1 hypothetical protein EN807_26885 [Mesorhizobium sp. M5C.F.Ca.ET.164.01.1.1]